MDSMLRLIVLLATHLSMLGAGVGLTLITVRARRAALDARAEALDTPERCLELRSERDHGIARGRHRARPITPLTATMPRITDGQPISGAPWGRPFIVPKPPSLVNASLAEAEVILATQRAQRVQERRAFVDLMTTIVGPARIRQHVTAHAQVT